MKNMEKDKKVFATVLCNQVLINEIVSRFKKCPNKRDKALIYGFLSKCIERARVKAFEYDTSCEIADYMEELTSALKDFM